MTRTRRRWTGQGKHSEAVRIVIASTAASEISTLQEQFQEFGGCSFATAGDTDAMGESLSTGAADLLVCDLDLPGDPLLLIRDARHARDSLDPFIPVIVVGWRPDREIVSQIVESGADSLLRLPVGGPQLAGTVDTLVHARKPFVVTSDYIGPDRHSGSDNGNNTLVIQGGTLIDGSGGKPKKNDYLVVEGTRIKSIGAKPKRLNLKDRNVEVISAAGQWVMPGLIDAHVHLSFGHPMYPGIGRGTVSAEFSTLRTAMNAQAVLRAGVTSVSVPGGAWFSDVAVREAINAGLITGPRIYCAGRLLSVLGGGGDREPHWVGTPDHAISKLCHGADQMVAEVRRQAKHHVNFIKLIDSDWGDFQAFTDDELAAIAREAHRRNLKCAIHSRGSASTRAATKAGFDWIIHGDFTTNADLDLMAKKGTGILPTFTSAILAIAREGGFGLFPNEKPVLTRHMDACADMCRRTHKRGVKLLAGSDTGNIGWMSYGTYHAKEAEIFVNEVGLTPMEAILASTANNAMTVGLEDEVGTLEAPNIMMH